MSEEIIVAGWMEYAPEERYTMLDPLPITRVLRAQYVLLAPGASASPRPR